MQAVMRQAESATEVILALTRIACRRAQAKARMNAYGVLMKPGELLADLRAARGEITKAIEMIETTRWPTDAEYDSL